MTNTAPDRSISVAALDSASLAPCMDRLAEILHACVHDGASVGFVLPFDLGQARAFWRDKVAPSLAVAKRVLLTARIGADIAGTAQLDLDTMPNQRHRGEVSKVLVDPRCRRAGVARALMLEIERSAAARGRWLLTLDTAGDAAEALYRSLGYSFAGEERFDPTRLMYKDLRGA